MSNNYWSVAFRSVWKNKFYSAISIFGLAIALTAAILILLWCQDEKSYNSAVRDSKDIYKVVPAFNSNGNKWYFPTVPPAIAAVSGQVAGLEKGGRIYRNGDEMVLKYKGKNFSEKNSAYADAALLDILDLDFIEGNRTTPFPDKHSIILTAPAAKKYFGDEPALGKLIERADKKETYTVTGVVKATPNSQTNFDCFLPLNSINGVDQDWMDYDFEWYVRLTPQASSTAVAGQLTRLQKANTSDDLTRSLNYRLQPLSEVHLYNADGSDGGITRVRIFTWVAFVILLIASVNYINLTTAKAAQRAKEIGVRKIIGAGKRQLFLQFIGESIMVFALATIVALLLTRLAFPLYNSLTGKQLSLSASDPALWQVLGLTLTITLLASAIYPAILLSSFKPLQAIKGKFSIGRGNHFLRKFLVVGQFSFSVIFIICTIVIGRQLSYVQAKNLGLDKTNVFRVDLKHMYGNYEAVKSELMRDPSVEGTTAAGQDPLQVQSNTTSNSWPGKDAGKTFLISTLPVERDFLSVMHLKMAEGKGFSGTAADSSYYLLNETAVREMGLKDPIGKPFSLYDKKGVIAGIVQDFHFKDMHRKIGPCVILWRPQWVGQLYVRPTAGHTPEALAAVQRLWKSYNPEYPFEYNFLDEAYSRLYANDQRSGALFKVFAAIAIFISCLGLFGLITYTAQLKTREIGIRKVLGASVSSVTGLLAKEFIALVGIAILIASPVGWFLMERWLQDFAYRITIGGWVFLLAGAFALLIAAGTISFQAIKAALANPVKSLRTD